MRSIKLDLTKIRGLTGKCVVATSDADISAGLTVTIGSQGSKCCVAPAVLNLIESGCRGWNAECGKTKMILRTGIEPVTLRCTRGIQLQSHALPTELSKDINVGHSSHLKGVNAPHFKPQQDSHSGSCSVNELPSLNYPHPWTSKASHGAHINKGERTLWFFA